MPQQVKAVFRCSTVKQADSSEELVEVELYAEYSDPSWEQFTEATPWGHLQMHLTEKAVLARGGFFVPGGVYSLTFERAGE